MDNVQAGLVVVGLVNGVRLWFDVNDTGHKSFILFAVALVAGLLLGLLHFYGLTVETGLLVAIGSSGAYQIASKVGGK